MNTIAFAVNNCRCIAAQLSIQMANGTVAQLQAPKQKPPTRNVIYGFVFSSAVCLLHNGKYFTLFLLIYYQNAIRFVYKQMHRTQNKSKQWFAHFFWRL